MSKNLKQVMQGCQHHYCTMMQRRHTYCIISIILLYACATISSQDPAEVTLRPRDQQVKAGGIAGFYCIARGDPFPSIQWKKNGKRISSTQSRHLVQEIGNGGSLLRIEPVRASMDNAIYECVAENGVGDAVSAKAELRVFETDKLPDGFPQITQAPDTKVVEIGRNVVLLCSAIGTPSPTITWVRDKLPVYMDNLRYRIVDSGALQITNSEKEDQGMYECVAENVVGTMYSQSAMLYVKVRRVRPQFSIPPPPVQEVMLNSDLNLTCVAVGSPMPFVKWRKGLVTDIAPDNELHVGHDVLELTNIQESANYTCVAANALGVIEATTQVKVQSLPGPPTDVQVLNITATSVRLTWSYTGAESLQYYVIQYKPKFANQDYSEISGIIFMYYTVRQLSPYTEYEMFVIGVNNIGRGPPSAPIIVTTGETGNSFMNAI